MPEPVRNLVEELNLQNSAIKENPSRYAYENSLHTLFRLHQQLKERDMLPKDHVFKVNHKGVIRVFEDDFRIAEDDLPPPQINRSKSLLKSYLAERQKRKVYGKRHMGGGKLINFSEILRKKSEKEPKDKK